MQDEGLHEIQLNGKQLVFLFMAATVVAVVIFLCGVMVGRGVPQRAGIAPAVPAANADPTAAVQQLPPPPAVASTGSTPVTAGETLTYADRLADPTPPAETLRPVAETAVLTQPAVVAERAPSPAPPKPAAAAPPPAKPAAAAPAPVSPKPAPSAAPAPAAAPPKPVTAAAAPKPLPALPPKPALPAAAPAPVPVTSAAVGTLAEPPGNGFVVQVAAVRKRAEAETIARRLSAKGYPTFITTSGANFRVRVGKFDDRREAETVAGRLEREERVVKPWITR